MTTLIRLKQVSALTGLPRSTIYHLIQKGQFPKQIKLSERSVAWSLASVESWVAERISA